MIRVFLDANVIFSAAYKPSRRLAALWTLNDVELVTSGYVIAEVGRNIATKYPQQIPLLHTLLGAMKIVAEPESGAPANIELHPKDVPVLRAAIASGATYLLTGDSHFMAYFGTTVSGVTILRPAEFLDMHPRSAMR